MKAKTGSCWKDNEKVSHVRVLWEHWREELIPSAGGVAEGGNNWAQPARPKQRGCLQSGEAQGGTMSWTTFKLKSFYTKRQNYSNHTNCRRQTLRQPCNNLDPVNVHLCKFPVFQVLTPTWQRIGKQGVRVRVETYFRALNPSSRKGTVLWSLKQAVLICQSWTRMNHV